MAKDVKCSVDSCKYYCDGCCEANCIHVGNCHCVEAKRNAETACDTFECRGNKFFNVILKIRYCYASHNDTFFHYEHDDFI